MTALWNKSQQTQLQPKHQLNQTSRRNNPLLFFNHISVLIPTKPDTIDGGAMWTYLQCCSDLSQQPRWGGNDCQCVTLPETIQKVGP